MQISEIKAEVTLTLLELEEIKGKAYQEGFDVGIGASQNYKRGYDLGYEDATALAEESRVADVAVGVRAC